MVVGTNRAKQRATVSHIEIVSAILFGTSCKEFISIP
jgi:hypothetical protein